MGYLRCDVMKNEAWCYSWRDVYSSWLLDYNSANGHFPSRLLAWWMKLKIRFMFRGFRC